MPGFGAKGRGGKKLFNDRPSNDPRDRSRQDRLASAISYAPKKRYPMPGSSSKAGKVSFAERKPAPQQSRPAASGSAHRRGRGLNHQRRSARAPPPRPTGYTAKNGWLTPWKKIPLPVSPAPTLRELAIIETWKTTQKTIRNGPLFVRRVVDFGARVNKPGLAMPNAFNALPTYSARYERRYRQRPNFTGKLWLKQILPPELHSICDPTLRNKKPALPNSTASKSRFNIDDFSDNEDNVELDPAADDSDAENEAEAEEVDEDWENDESDNDDYNGEKYFDDGEGDDVVADDAEFGDDHGGGADVQEREFGRDEEFDV